VKKDSGGIMIRMTGWWRPVILYPLLFLLLGDRVRAFNCTEPEHKRMQARLSVVFLYLLLLYKNFALVMVIMIIADKVPLWDR
jgi:hypothetical protein